MSVPRVKILERHLHLVVTRVEEGYTYLLDHEWWSMLLARKRKSQMYYVVQLILTPWVRGEAKVNCSRSSRKSHIPKLRYNFFKNIKTFFYSVG